MKIALVTCSNLPAWEVDDRRLHDAFCEKGVETCHPSWDAPRFDLKTVLMKQGSGCAFFKPAIGTAARDTLRFHVIIEGLSTAEQYLARNGIASLRCDGRGG